MKSFFSVGVSTLFRANRLVRTPPSPARRRLRLVLTLGAALVVLVFNLVLEPLPLVHALSTFPGLWITWLSVAVVLLTLVHPLWAWRSAAVLLVLSPMVFRGLTDLWGWPWPPGTIIGCTVVLLVVAQSYRQAVLVWVFVWSLVAVWLSHLLGSKDIFLAGVVVGGVLVLGNAMRLRRIAEAERVEQRRRLEEEETRAATLEERAVIARELHDVVAHHMSVLALRAGSARYRFSLPPELVVEFAEMQETAREGLTEMRRLLGVLRNSAGEVETAPQPRVEQIAELVDRLRGAGVVVSLEISGDVLGVPSGVALSAYRIAQEALSNAVRHAPGSTVDVRISVSSELSLMVANSAVEGPPPDDRPKHGLLGMRERVAALRGTFRAGPGDAGGFVVAVTLPLNGG
ncbi:sensor histidine kinase [Lentzea aerocolonigenes]|uniref:sensor histidine kinase n=1 Tax=Lentzea aerocolonigenes TaxID=68170 RepID=UPI000AD9F5AD|nr:histidine kinase [Lentzea aerocolonigenes]